MKKLIIILTFFNIALFSISSSAMAINLDGLVSDVKKEVKGEKENILKKLDAKVDQEISQFKSKIESEINNLENLVLTKVRVKLSKYAIYFKVVAGILVIIILSIIFVIWRLWKKVTNVRNIIGSAANYKDIKKQIALLEEKVAKLEK